jgi:hypothetical protein
MLLESVTAASIVVALWLFFDFNRAAAFPLI